MQTLTMLGCGKMGRALARRWSQAKVFNLGQVLTCSEETAQAAVDFIGAGSPITDLAAIEPADAFFLACSDGAIAGLANQLASTGMIMEGALCWHASGAIPSSVLKPLQEAGAEIASMHPVKSFAAPASAAETFPGTPCVIEGSQEACQLLSEAC
ncbi:MAG TPA: NAD(P)-binding domain-containing protein, partial [Gemmatales bacterium]|nr:NAD(P)-binding domain-containing protein [Gemmatales bacterium]